MANLGPDIPFLLYAYAIFALVTHDEDYVEVRALIERAKVAEVQRMIYVRATRGEAERDILTNFSYGKVFDLASIGFFRYAAVQHMNGLGWEMYALCRFLVYNDFNGSFDAFINAFRYEPENVATRENFDIMLTHFFGKDPYYKDQMVKKRLQYYSQMDADKEEARRIVRVALELRESSARRIQLWYKDRRAIRIFNLFLKMVRDNIEKRRRLVRKRG